MFMTPTYINILIMYAICNIHDCTWGNRETTLTQIEMVRENEFKAYRTRWVLIWVYCNVVFAYLVNALDK
jgi:hypothetical protein